MIAALLLAAASVPPALAFPVACRPGVDCAIQNYPDDDPGPGVKDYACGQRSYDKHDGTDIRLPSMARQRAGVAVLAVAAGTVLRVRDGIEDVSMRVRPFAAGQDCGNGLVIDHGGGWETQYCHMAQGSLVVRSGQAVAAGAMLGKVGLSGNTEFPHLHLTVRQDGKAVDPFAWGQAAGRCGGGRSLWAAPITYARGAVLAAGFSAGAVTLDRVQDAGDQAGPRPARDQPLVAYAQAIGLETGDIQRIVLSGADGAVLADNRAEPLDRAKAQTILFAGKRAPAGGWASGVYRATYQVTRAGRVVVTKQFQVAL